MKIRNLSTICCLLSVILSTGLWAKQRKKAPVKIPLTEDGKKLEAQYDSQLKSLKAEITAALPKVDSSVKASFLKALNDEKNAKAKLEAAKKDLGKVKAAQGLVGHAKGKWIGGADKGIAKAKAMLKKAKNDTERKAAEKELAKWQKNREDGVKALKERQAMLDKAKLNEPKMKKAYAEAQKSLDQAKSTIADLLQKLKLEAFLQSDKLDKKLTQFVIINEATPNGLAAFTQQSPQNKKLIDYLLSNTDLMRQMLYANGAKDGKYGKAMQIYAAIQRASKSAKEGTFQRLALAISLEHAVPISQRNPEAASNAPATVNPVKRFQHYEKAFHNNELDPAFKFLSVWDYRMVVNGNEPDETLSWGREMLRNYRPDQISTKDYRWRYVSAVRTDIRYGSQDNKYDQPQLQFFQNILNNGGICGRRAFYGRFILRAFGIPTIARPQKGHAALAHWTPKGWVICLGANWGSGWAPRPYSDLDFLAITQGRQNPKAYLTVKRAAWIGDTAGEERKYGLHSSSKSAPAFWNSLSLNIQKKIIEQSDAKVLAAVGSDIAEANESRIKEKVTKATISSEDKKIVVTDNGVIKIPAVACSKPSNSTGKIKFMKSYLGGMQLHYERNGRIQDFEYTFDAPAAGKYQLSARVVTPSWKQDFLVSANGGKPVNFELPYTVGMWDTTKPVIIQLKKGKNILKFSRGAESDAEGKRNKGVTFKEFALMPAK